MMVSLDPFPVLMRVGDLEINLCIVLTLVL